MTVNSATTTGVEIARERLAAVYERGLERCRAGDWEDGLVDLAFVAEKSRKGELPALCCSYLGYGIARYRGQIKKGLRLCRHAVKLEFYQPESYVNLARVALLSKRHRFRAIEAVMQGLEIDPEHPELLKLHRRLGIRAKSILPFLSRRHFLNRLLGWFRYLAGPGAVPIPEEEVE